jgi:hypothetical protein
MKIEYRSSCLKELHVSVPSVNARKCNVPDSIEVNGEALKPTDRFWKSFFARFGLAEQVFRYFDYDEVLARLVLRCPDDRLRLSIERSEHAAPRLLAVSSPASPLLRQEKAVELVSQHNGTAVSYADGVLSSSYTPRSGERSFEIGPDRFHNEFILEMPVDGYGQPRIFLSLLREVCSNGAVGYSRAFRSDIRMGHDVEYAIDRALRQFDHEEGFAALRQRFDAAQKSWASVNESQRLRRVIGRIGSAGAELDRIAGDLQELYGVANLDVLTVKRQRILPVRCRVYDLLNYASELATHHAVGDNRMRLQAFIGTIVSDEYDLENTAEKVPEFRDMFAGLN